MTGSDNDIDDIPSSQPQSSIEIDYERYAACLEDSDLSEDQKREFIDTLWSIICAFVDLGFEVHPLQQAVTQAERQDLASAIADVVHSDPTPAKEEATP